MFASAFATQLNVLYALFVRDLQTRFGGGGGGYLNYVVTLGWPLAHIALLLIIYNFLGRSAPMGRDATIFFATGLLPYMVFYYPTRFMMMSVVMNQPLTAFPVVKLFDIILARAIVEVITGLAVVCVTGGILYGMGHDVLPRDGVKAVSALGASLFMAVGIGSFNAVMMAVFRMWIIIFILMAISLYIVSGIVFVIPALPDKYQYYLSWNPVAHLVSWYRAAYYDGYETAYIPSHTYPFIVGLIALLLTLVLERYVLPKLSTT